MSRRPEHPTTTAGRAVSERIFLSPGEKTAGHYLLVDPQTLGQLRILRVGDVELQLDGQRLMVRGIPVHLPRKEFIVLRQLMDNVGRVVTRCELLDNAWGPDRKDARNYLAVHIRRLRRKIEDDADRPTRIRTVRQGWLHFRSTTRRSAAAAG